MIKKVTVSGIVAGVLYFMLIWLGNKFVLNREEPLLEAVVQSVFFAIFMGAFYYFSERRKEKKEKDGR